MPDMAGGMWGWMMALMLLVPYAFLVLVTALIVWGVRSGRGAAPDAPLTILQRRYARGDVRAEEYGGCAPR